MLSKMRFETASTKDERIKTMNEIIGGIRVIKMYTWENSFINLINLYRKYIKLICANYTYREGTIHIQIIFTD